ncbi:5027_t:CDS:2 [Funneliformis mosseae]|uniref:5027_t:CDS:1 n=1 Tax=Funneliformis mosseae TaxID=27381 RepID=A0A9N9BI56_FUNMO|nr:5027_t:CDS:2 [Funneliformis mosseae]
MLLGTYGIDIRMLTTKLKQKHIADNDEDENSVLGFPLQKCQTLCVRSPYTMKFDFEIKFSKNNLKDMNIEVDYLSREECCSISTRKYLAFCHNRDDIYEI